MPITEADGKKKKASYPPWFKLKVIAEYERSGMKKKSFLHANYAHVQASQLRTWIKQKPKWKAMYSDKRTRNRRSSCSGRPSSIEKLKDNLNVG